MSRCALGSNCPAPESSAIAWSASESRAANGQSTASFGGNGAG